MAIRYTAKSVHRCKSVLEIVSFVLLSKVHRRTGGFNRCPQRMLADHPASHTGVVRAQPKGDLLPARNPEGKPPHVLWVALVFLAGLACVQATDSVRWRITGAYSGIATFQTDNLVVVLDGVDMSIFTDYDAVRPLTGGRRAVLYLDTDTSRRGAEFAAFIYNGAGVLKKASTPGLFNITLDEFGVFNNADGVVLYLPVERLGVLPIKLWTTDLQAQ